MPINRDAALNYARKYWNRVTDDNKFWTSSEAVSLAAKRRSMGAPASDGWEAVFVSNGDGGENAIFRRTVGGGTEDKPDPIAIWDELDDCTHYVCRCLIKEGIDLTETPRANELAAAVINSSKARTLALKVNREQGAESHRQRRVQTWGSGRLLHRDEAPLHAYGALRRQTDRSRRRSGRHLLPHGVPVRGTDRGLERRRRRRLVPA